MTNKAAAPGGGGGGEGGHGAEVEVEGREEEAEEGGDSEALLGELARLSRVVRRRDEEVATLRQRLRASEATTARLWRLADQLEASAAAATSLASRETFDVEGIRPLCDAVRSEPQQRLPARIRRRTSDLRMRRLWGSPADDPANDATSQGRGHSLLVLTVGTSTQTHT